MIVEEADPRKWWLQHQTDYPTLSQMALEFLAISTKVERVSSSSARTITDYHSCLGEDSIEAIECPSGIENRAIPLQDTPSPSI